MNSKNKVGLKVHKKDRRGGQRNEVLVSGVDINGSQQRVVDRVTDLVREFCNKPKGHMTL